MSPLPPCPECNGIGCCHSHAEPECDVCTGDAECPYCAGTGLDRYTMTTWATGQADPADGHHRHANRPDVDLDIEDIRLADGRRLTNEVAAKISREVLPPTRHRPAA